MVLAIIKTVARSEDLQVEVQMNTKSDNIAVLSVRRLIYNLYKFTRSD